MKAGVLVSTLASLLFASTSVAQVSHAGAQPNYTIYPGFIGVDLNNNTNGAYANSQVYVTVVGIDPATGVFAHVSYDGAITDMSLADNSGSGHLTKNGTNYPNYSFTLADSSNLLKLPQLSSGRAYISLGEPMYLEVVQGGGGSIGYAGPNPQNPTDPNNSVHYDWYEFTYNSSGIYINTTQVDQFGLPLLLDVWGSGGSFHQQTGITETVAQIDQEFANVASPFNSIPVSNLRILSPTKSTFAAGQANGNYFDSYISSVWSYYGSTPLTVSLFGGSREFTGTTSGSTFNFSEVNLNNGAYVGNSYSVAEPSTQDVLQCSGTMAQGNANADINTVDLALEAQFCAAFNRHAMMNVSTWTTPSAWYAAPPANYYAQFWHQHSVGGLAYGFAYDDVDSQSSTITTSEPEHMAFGIGW